MVSARNSAGSTASPRAADRLSSGRFMGPPSSCRSGFCDRYIARLDDFPRRSIASRSFASSVPDRCCADRRDSRRVPWRYRNRAGRRCAGHRTARRAFRATPHCGTTNTPECPGPRTWPIAGRVRSRARFDRGLRPRRHLAREPVGDARNICLAQFVRRLLHLTVIVGAPAGAEIEKLADDVRLHLCPAIRGNLMRLPAPSMPWHSPHKSQGCTPVISTMSPPHVHAARPIAPTNSSSAAVIMRQAIDVFALRAPQRFCCSKALRLSARMRAIH